MLHSSRSRHLSRDAVLDAGRAVALDGTMRSHLEDCEPCQARVRPWRSLTALARRWEETRPPEAAVLRAKTLAGASSATARPVRLRTVLQHLGPGLLLPAGARGSLADDLDAYQVVYHAEEFSVDLRVSRTLSRRRVIVVGQIKHLARPSQRLGNIPVLLTSRSRVSVRTLSNEWGEFSFEHEDQEHMWLEVAPEPGRCIRIPIKSRPAPAPRPQR